jgi:hypothetical protein
MQHGNDAVAFLVLAVLVWLMYSLNLFCLIYLAEAFVRQIVSFDASLILPSLNAIPTPTCNGIAASVQSKLQNISLVLAMELQRAFKVNYKISL